MTDAPPAAPTMVDEWVTLQPAGDDAVPPSLVADRYTLLGLVGTGGMGTVYRAHDHELGEVVALKLLRRELLGSPEMLELFRNEVRLARRVTHPNVVRTYDIGQRRDDRFITMEYVEGQPLSALIQGAGPLAIGRAVPILRGVCRGLGAAHAVGVIHRDLKPENVLLAADGRVVVTDFGIACVYAATAPHPGLRRVVGTPSYMAPEQVQARVTIDQRADIYAFGALLYELVTGQPPWITPDLLARIRGLPPDPRLVNPSLPDPVAHLALACLEPDPELRPATMATLLAALDALDDHPASVTSPPEPRPRTRPLAVSNLEAPPEVAPTRRKTVAIVPFRYRGPPEDAELVAELADELADTLSEVPALRVRSTSAVAAFRDAPLATLRAELGVQVLVQGSVEGRAGAFRVAVRLVTTEDGFQLWARRFECPVTGLLAVMGQAAAAIAARLTVELETPRRLPPTNPEAMDLYLRGRAALRDLWPSRNAIALELLGRGHAIAPDDPTIGAAFARACTRRWFWTGAPEDAARAKAVLARATELAPDSAEVALAAAGVHFMVNDHAATVRHLAVALERSPSFAEARELLGRVALELGRLEFGLRQLHAAEQLDPRWGQPVEVARALALLGRWSEATDLVSKWEPEREEISAKAIVCARLALWAPEPAPFLAAQPPSAVVTEPGRAYVAAASALRTTGGDGDAETWASFDRYLAETRQSLRFHLLMHQLAAEAHLYAAARTPDATDGRAAHVGAALDLIAAAAAAGFADLGWLDHCPLLEVVRHRTEHSTVRSLVATRIATACEAMDGAA